MVNTRNCRIGRAKLSHCTIYTRTKAIWFLRSRLPFFFSFLYNNTDTRLCTHPVPARLHVGEGGKYDPGQGLTCLSAYHALTK